MPNPLNTESHILSLEGSPHNGVEHISNKHSTDINIVATVPQNKPPINVTEDSPTPLPRFIRVAINVPLPQTFTYINPLVRGQETATTNSGLFDDRDMNINTNLSVANNSAIPIIPTVGCWVEVPFRGRGGRSSERNRQSGRKPSGEIGLVLAVSDTSDYPEDKCQAWIRVLPDGVLPPDWLRLVHFSSRHYHFPIGQVVAMAYPVVVRKNLGVALSATAQKKAFRDNVKAMSLAAEPIVIQNDTGYPRKKNWHTLLALAQKHPLLIVAEVKKSHPTLIPVLFDWLEKGWFSAAHLAVESPTTTPAEATPELSLTAEQNIIVADIAAQEGYRVHLLQGITGSGKTEVYFTLADRALKEGGQVLFLMPEIALTPQMQGRLSRRFPNIPIAILHSGLADGARQKAFAQTMSGEAKIVVGTRLAIFTPMKNCVLIIVDEEHDHSFKQNDQAFSYSARDLAVFRAHDMNIPIVLGSATPSLESFHHATEGRYTLHHLTIRAVSGAKPPAINIINVRGKKMPNGFAEESLSAINIALSAGEQVLVFLNRRGYAPTLFCQACGWLAGCESCSANLVMHSAGQSLRCHHCGYREPIPHACPQCGNPDILMTGYGTQKIEEFLNKKFPDSTIMRIDRDASGSFKVFTEQQRAIADNRVNLIIGTQMMAKGHDFPNLTTVVVLGADSVLFASDYRGPERLFSLLTQVAGRAGRHQKAGQVFIQTAWHDHPLFTHLIAGDYSAFATEQLANRRAGCVPPYSYQALLRVESSALKTAMEWLKIHRAEFAKYAPSGVTLYDAIPMRLARKAGWERMQMLIESTSRPLLHQFLSSLTGYLYTIRPDPELKWWVDVAPLEV